MSAYALDEMLEVIRNSGLIPAARLETLAEHALDGESLLEELLKAGLLTPWHRDRLQEGKWKGFFLGKYKILQPLGAGAMGSVFLAEHKVMRHRVAIKVLARRLVAKSSNVIRFEREARAAAAVNHPNVVRAYDIDREGDTHYLVMEFVQGENLQKIVQENGPLDPHQAADHVRQIALGLDEAHKNGLVHRDIKPSNLLLDSAGQVKVLDLGLARMEDETIPSVTLMNDSKLIGTVDYLAPEQARNSHAIDGRADIYSLGCTFYFLLTGSPPFPSGSITERILKHQTRRPADISKRRAGVPNRLIQICHRMMEKDPARRFATAGEAATALVEFLAGNDTECILPEAKGNEPPEELDYLAFAEDSDPGFAGRSAAGRSSQGRSSSGRNEVAKTAAVDELDLAELPEKKHSAIAKAASAKPVAATAPPQATPKESSIFDDLAPLIASASSSGQSVLDGPLPAGDTLLNGWGSTGGGSLAGTSAGASNPNLGSNSALASALLERARAETSPRESHEGINYPLWFLVIAGVILGFILVGVGYSYVTSFEPQPEFKADHRDRE